MSVDCYLDWKPPDLKILEITWQDCFIHDEIKKKEKKKKSSDNKSNPRLHIVKTKSLPEMLPAW